MAFSRLFLCKMN